MPATLTITTGAEALVKELGNVVKVGNKATGEMIDANVKAAYALQSLVKVVKAESTKENPSDNWAYEYLTKADKESGRKVTITEKVLSQSHFSRLMRIAKGHTAAKKVKFLADSEQVSKGIAAYAAFCQGATTPPADPIKVWEEYGSYKSSFRGTVIDFSLIDDGADWDLFMKEVRIEAAYRKAIAS